MTETRIKLGSSFDPRMIPDNAWTFRGFSRDGDYKIWTYTDTALDITIEKKEPVFQESLINLNRHEVNETYGRRWRDDTAIGQRVSRIPLNVFYRDFAGRHNDPDFSDWWHARDENQIYRTKKGKI